jgi:serine/threonine-protein kinase RsbW
MPSDVLELALETEPSSVVRARRAVETFAGRHGICDGSLQALKLAVSEACTNVVLHAYRDREPGPLRLRVEIEGRQLRVTVCDEGVGILPRVDSPGLGLGLPLIASVTEDLQVDSQDSRTRVRMSLGLDRAPKPFTGLAG